MFRYSCCIAIALLVCLLATCTGCGPSTPQTPAKPDAAAGAPEGSDEISSALASLSAEDRAAAQKQKVCPVTGELLGSMGTPIKVTIQDQTVFLCCEGCIEKLEKDPEKYLSKLRKDK